ncbi:YigZ family protein [Acholeplasma vituli]|uniref:YigZ family protein n=1 Tax=Paracholeplasma vituli TaxID=69473 RepID=A0ABT2PTS0_9MOLU|nr:YigZ family protein [Paracholeplasma vituli]MCU0104349.1 YigZ family protein [Paracholeplasma vituli]
MFYIESSVTNEIIIDKSRFIGQLYPVSSISEINQILDEVRKRHREANHNCYAYIIQEGQEMKASDDKEPAKTAGIPILEVLKHHQLTNVLCIITRYFGGIKLGAGGLIRAYSGATAEVIKQATLYRLESKPFVKITMPYGLFDTFVFQTKDNIRILDKRFGSEIEIDAILHNTSIQELMNQFHQGKYQDLGMVDVKIPKID